MNSAEEELSLLECNACGTENNADARTGRRYYQLVSGFVIACRPAWFAIHQSVGTQADINDRLAQTAILFTEAAGFGLLALHATGFGRTGSGTHASNVSLRLQSWNVTSVTTSSGQWPVVSGQSSEP